MSTYGGFPSHNPDARESISERERSAAHPLLFRIVTFCPILSGAFFVVSFMFSFVMFMNARESVLRESTGVYHPATFRVLQSYGQEHKGGGWLSGTGVQRRAFARGLVEGNQEWVDLGPYLGAVPKDEETVLRSVPPETIIPVFYNPSASGDYRVQVRGSVPPVEANEKLKTSSAKYGALATGLMLFTFMRLRKLCF